MDDPDANASEFPFKRPLTAREEAAAADRSKREAEMAELRRARASQMAKSKSVKISASEAARKKREEELEEMRRNKAGSNDEFRQRLSQHGGALVTDMDAWRSNQWGAQEADRKNKIAAQTNLHGHSGYEQRKTAADVDKAAMSQAQRATMAAMANMKFEDDPPAPAPAVSPSEGEGGTGTGRRSVMFKDAPDENIPKKEGNQKLRVSFSAGAATDIAAAATREEEEDAAPKEEKAEEEAAAPAPSPAPPAAESSSSSSSPSPAAADDDASSPPDDDDDDKVEAPGYSRVDIKFSFGLIVRSSSADGFGDAENLRDNETLKKCMESTSKILREQMPSRPETSAGLKYETGLEFRRKFPEAYYDYSLEPTIISIEEDKKAEEEGSGKKTAKGNKRTLVKASFPVFLRDEAMDAEGKKRMARMLKETKTTVFKALRAAVSGGSFLK